MSANDTTQTILRRAGAFCSGTALSRITGMVRDMVMAWAFGASSSVAALLVALRFSHLPRRILGEGAMQSAFIPQFVATRATSTECAFGFFQNLSAVLTLLLTVIILAGEGILGLLLVSDFFGPEGREIITLTMLMLPGLLFICLAGINGALLQCEGRYFLVSGAPIAFNIAWIAGAVALSPWQASEAMPWLAVAITIACLSQWIVTMPAVSSMTGLKNPMTAWRHFDLHSPDLRKLIKALSLGILGVSAQQFNGAIDALFATYAAPEGPAYLWYAIRVQQLPLGLFGVALSGALLPSLSRAVRDNDLPRSRHYLEFSIRQAALMILPATLGLIATGGAIINLLFGRGDFSEAATVGTTWCLWGYALGLPAATIILLQGPGFYATGDYSTPTRGVVLSIATNVVLNFLTVGILGMGPASIAGTTTIASWINVAYLHIKLKQRLGAYITSDGYAHLGKVLIAGIAATCVTASVGIFLGQPDLLVDTFNNVPTAFPRDFISQVSQLAISGTIFVASWLAVALLLNVDLLAAFRKEAG